MCFFTHPKHLNVKVAKKDITCYKICEKVRGSNQHIYKVRSYIREFEYITEKLYQDLDVFKNIKVYNGTYSTIRKGYHSYSNNDKMNYFLYKDSLHLKCTIPKGSLYYYNPDSQEYVSNQIIIHKQYVFH
jgi:hypothetical protein